MNLLNKIKFKYVNYKGKKDYIAFIEKDKGFYKVRAKIIVIKDNQLFFCMDKTKKPGENDSGWFPGGSLEVATKEEAKKDPLALLYTIIKHESQEEMRITCKKWIFCEQDDWYFYDTKKDKSTFTGCPKIIDEETREESNSNILGTYSLLFIGVYDKKYTGTIAQRDKNEKVLKLGAFRTYEEIHDYLNINEKQAIKNYNPELVKIKKEKFSYEYLYDIISKS